MSRTTSIVVVLLSAIPGWGCQSRAPANDAPRRAAAFSARQGESVSSNAHGRLHPDAPRETAQWGQLAGVWRCTIPIVNPDGTAGESKATWTWSYVLDGYAVQDVYVGHRTDGRDDFYGTAIRKYAPAEARWEVAWFDNNPRAEGQTQETKRYYATYENEQIIMRQADGDPEWRTIFYEITESSFAWRNDPSGATMRCEKEAGSRE